MSVHVSRFFLTVLILLSSAPLCPAEEFPYRKNYPDVPVMELKAVHDLYKNDRALLLDARTKVEFDTIHVKNAIHLDFAKQDFHDKLQALRNDNPDRAIIIYDNGITCLKSYIAVQDAVDEEMTGVYAYDGGIQAWAEAYPADTLLMGEVIRNPATQLIPYDEYLKISLPFYEFKNKFAAAANAKVIDARDPKQRTKKLPGFEKALLIPPDKLISNIISKGRLKESQLFIFDQVGRQARWLMYYLEKHGYHDYYFLAGGATSVLQEQHYR